MFRENNDLVRLQMCDTERRKVTATVLQLQYNYSVKSRSPKYLTDHVDMFMLLAGKVEWKIFCDFPLPELMG